MRSARMQANPDCSAIVVTADSGPCVRDCVDALLASDALAELLLIDNASRDGIALAVATDARDDPRLCLLQNSRNIGFGAAVNRAALEAHGDWLLMLNPDCTLEAQALQVLLELARSDASIGLLGAVITDPQGHVEPASRRRDPLLRRVLADFGVARGQGVNVVRRIPPVALNVEAVSGALMLVRRTVFEQIGGMDEGYFLHFEDLDLCRRVRDAGHRVVLAGGVKVIHAKGSSSRHRPVFVAWHKHRSMWRWLRKFDPSLRHIVRAPLAWLAIWAHFIVYLPSYVWKKFHRPHRE